jgi:hypothetical protein
VLVKASLSALSKTLLEDFDIFSQGTKKLAYTATIRLG